jgi:hypothetical protein
VFLFRTWSRLTIIAAAVVCAPAAWADPALTTIQDILYKADGTRFDGTLSITWTTFQTAENLIVPTQGITAPVVNGVLKVQLAPTTTSPGANYTVRYSSQGKYQGTEIWAVPPSATPLRIKDVRVSSGSIIGAPPPVLTQVQMSDVTGLIDALNARTTKGPGFAPGRSAIINASGQIDAAAGNPGDCVHVDGTSGPCGGQGNPGTSLATFVDAETPAGTVNGVNATFALANAPSPQTSLELYRNGLLMKQGVDYSLNGATVTFVTGSIPQTGDILTASYRYGGAALVNTSAFADGETPSGAVNGSNTTFTLAHTPAPAASLALYRNGLFMTQGVDYSLNGATVTFVASAAPQTGDVLTASYRYSGPQFATPQVLCSATGQTTNSNAPASIGTCSLQAGLLQPGDRVEIQFNYAHQGSASGFAIQVNWGGSMIATRAAAAGETALAGQINAGINGGGAQWNTQTWGSTSALATSTGSAPDSLASQIVINFLGQVSTGSADSVSLKNFTVIRYPAQ